MEPIADWAVYLVPPEDHPLYQTCAAVLGWDCRREAPVERNQRSGLFGVHLGTDDKRAKQRIGDRLVGDIGCALVINKGNVYGGVCLDLALAAMVTAGELRICQVVAVRKDATGRSYVLPPCSRCREFIRQMHEENGETDVILGRDTSSSCGNSCHTQACSLPLSRRAERQWPVHG